MHSAPWRGVACLVGGFVMHLTLGGIYTFGNLTSYLTSFLHERVSEQLDYSSTMWVAALMNVGQGVALPLGGWLYERLGPRLTCSLGCSVLTISVALSQYAVQVGVVSLAIVFGLIGGLGVGVAYAAPMSCAMKWFPNHRGLANGIIVAGFGLGSLVFNWIQTGYLNPDNLSVGADNYFHQAVVLDRVPAVFTLLAMVYALLQIPSVLVLRDPPRRLFCAGSSGRLTSSDLDLDFASPIDDLVDSQECVGVREAVSSTAFLQLYIIFFLNTFTIGFINPLWKAYGQTFIADDHFLAFVGSMSAVFNCLGRVVWGSLYDRTSFKTSMLMALCVLCAGVGSLPLTPLVGGGWILAVWLWLINASFAANFCLVVSAVAAAFGVRHAAAIYGLIFTAMALSSPLTVAVTPVLLDSLGYAGAFYVQAAVILTSILVTLSYKERRLRTIGSCDLAAND